MAGVWGGTLALVAALAPAFEDPAERAWNQPRADAAGTSALAVAGVHSEPAVAWRHALGEVVCEPVAWGGVLFAVGRETGRSARAAAGGERRLHAFDLESGAELDVERLGRGDAVALAAWNGAAIVVDGRRVLTYSLKGQSFRFGKKAELDGDLGEPCVADGRLLVGDGRRVHCLDAQTLAVLGSVAGGGGRPALGGTRDTPIVATVAVGSALDRRFDVLQLLRAGFRGGKDALSPATTEELGTVAPATRDGAGLVLALATPAGGELWFARSPRPLLAASGEPLPACLSNRALLPIDGVPAFVAGELHGFGADGTLYRAGLDGKYFVVVEASALPPGARAGRVSAARDVLYLGNWAVERESGRVLWCRAELDPVTPVIPLGDGRAVVGTRAGELVGLVDPARTGTPDARPEPARAERPRPTAPRPVAPRPDGASAILADGSLLAGPLAPEADGRLRAPDGRVLAPAELAHATLAGGERVTHAEHPVYLAWRAPLAAELAARLDELALAYARERLVADAQRVLRDALAHGLAPERRRALESLVSGRPENRDANAEAKRERLRKEERAVRAAAIAAHVAAAAWCAERELTGAASALLADARRLLPEDELPDVAALAARLVPPEFPWKDAPDAAARWLDWAGELLPAEAHFVAPDAATRARLPASFAAGCALATANLVLHAEECDPVVIGACLRKGEGTLRALAELLPGDPARARAPLEVRIHATRESYLAVSKDSPWSVGRYSPREDASSFHVPRDADGRADARGLASVLAHELTHHYVGARWLAERWRTGQPGYWIVEGFADFVGDQVLELGRADRGFENATVVSLDTAAHARRAGWLVPLAELLATSQDEFQELGDEPLGELRLRYTLGSVVPTHRSLFYDHSAALVFFLMNRAGPEVRAAFLAALRAFYEGHPEREIWKAFGRESAEALERDLGAFLDSLVE